MLSTENMGGVVVTPSQLSEMQAGDYISTRPRRCAEQGRSRENPYAFGSTGALSRIELPSDSR